MATAAPGTVRVVGYRELIAALRTADRQQQKAVRDVIRQAGAAVRLGASMLVTRQKPGDPTTAAGYRVRVRARGVAVEQSLRKTTGVHPEWGAWQMRHALIPALDIAEPETERRMEQALDVVCQTFNAGGSVRIG